MITAALNECSKLYSMADSDSFVKLAKLVKICTSAFSSAEVAYRFCSDVVEILIRVDPTQAIVEGVRAAGTIPALVLAMSTHAFANPELASNAIYALTCLATNHVETVNELVLFSTGLDVILAVMSAHPLKKDVQCDGCDHLWRLAEAASQAALDALRESTAPSLLRAALSNFPEYCEGTVRDYAERALCAFGLDWASGDGLIMIVDAIRV